MLGHEAPGEFGCVELVHRPQVRQGLLGEQQCCLGRQAWVLLASLGRDPVRIVAAWGRPEDPLALAVRRVAHADTVGAGARRAPERAVASPRLQARQFGDRVADRELQLLLEKRSDQVVGVARAVSAERHRSEISVSARSSTTR